MTASTSAKPARSPSQRLAVAWRHPDGRADQPVGILSDLGGHYEFHYIQNAYESAGFIPFIGFPDLQRRYNSRRLFPLFSQRIMNPRRPDYVRFIQTLGLPPEANPWQQLARSEGRRQGDTITLAPEPIVEDDGTSTCNFFVHGIQPDTERQLRHFACGDILRLICKIDDPPGRKAPLIAMSGNGIPLGEIPDLLLDYVHEIMTCGDYRLVVRQINSPDVPIHQRLLVGIEGTARPNFRAFSGSRWRPLA